MISSRGKLHSQPVNLPSAQTLMKPLLKASAYLREVENEVFVCSCGHHD